MNEEAPQFTIKSLFVPFTTSKTIQWLVFIGILLYANALVGEFVFNDLQNMDKKFRLGAYVGLSEIYTYFNNPTTNSIEFLKNGLRKYPNSGDLWAALAYSLIIKI